MKREVLIAIVAFIATTGISRADDNPFLKATSWSATKIYNSCKKGNPSPLELGLCMTKFEKSLRTTLKAWIAKRLVEIDAIAEEEPAPGMLAGKGDAAAWRRDFLQAQSSWESYVDRQCQNVMAYDWYGGSGGGNAMTYCRLHHVASRLSELEAQ